MRAESKIALIVGSLLIIGAAVYFLRSSGVKPIELTNEPQAMQNTQKQQQAEKQKLPLPIELETKTTKKQNIEKIEKIEKQKSLKIPQTQPVSSLVTILPKKETEKGRAEISIDFGKPLEIVSTAPATKPAKVIESEKVVANKPVSVKLDISSETSQESQTETKSSVEEKTSSIVTEADLGKSEKIIHIVKPGDTLYDIAKKYYGEGRLWTIIAKANPSINPDRLRVGQKITIPPKLHAIWQFETGQKKLPPELTKSKLKPYVVKEGESFYTIARDVLGDASRWREIFQINKSAVKNDPKKLRTGQTIFLPMK